MVANLKRLYKSPDDVDLVVGIQLEEEMFPGTTVPKSALIISLFSLFGMGNSDRFSVGFAMMRCLLVDKPWDCRPSNALEDLLWAPKEVEGFPNFRFFNTFWMTELDLPAHGTNLLWRLITENSEIKCVQHSPLFPADPITNPVLCALPKSQPDIKELALTGVQVVLALIRQHHVELIVLAISLILAAISKYQKPGNPPVLKGWPILGKALTFQENPKVILLTGFQRYGFSLSRSFGIRLASLTHYVLTQPADLELMKEDNPYEVRFSLHSFLQAVNFSTITKKENFESDLHTKLIRTHLGDPATVATFANVIEHAARSYIKINPLTRIRDDFIHYDGLNDYFSHYIAFVVSRCVVGPCGYDKDELLSTFLKFNGDAVNAMGLSSLLPDFLQFLSAFQINKDFKTVRSILSPIIEARRKSPPSQKENPAFLDFIMDVVDDNERVAGNLASQTRFRIVANCPNADLVAIVVWGGLVNLQSTLSSTILDIINQPGLQETILSSLSAAKTINFDTFNRTPEWSLLRSAMFESIRLCGPITGPARICMENVALRSDSSTVLPKGQAATLSAYYTHRQKYAWGKDADRYDYQRFLKVDPPIGEPNFITWGLKGPHTCPGRWFAQATIQIMVKVLLEEYEFKPDRVLDEDEKYMYSAGNVMRTKVRIAVRKR